MGASIAAFIVEQRELLDRLERFAATPDYRRLLASIAPLAAGDLEPWLGQWLITPSFGLGERPIDLVQQGRLEIVEQLLARIGGGVVS